MDEMGFELTGDGLGCLFLFKTWMLVTKSSKLYYLLFIKSTWPCLALPCLAFALSLSLKLIITNPCKSIRVDPASAHLFLPLP
jgi:hypothetical protein